MGLLSVDDMFFEALHAADQRTAIKAGGAGDLQDNVLQFFGA